MSDDRSDSRCGAPATFLAALEALKPSAREGWDELMQDVRSWGVEEAETAIVRRVEHLVRLDRPGASFECRFANRSASLRFEHTLKGYRCALRASS